MKLDKSIIASFVLLVLIASLYRIMPGRPWGFAPQIAMALFSGSIVADKKYSFLLPLFSMLVSDVIYQVLYAYQLSAVPGFYDGQWINYLLILSVTVIGFAVKKNNVAAIAGGSVAAVLYYFFVSNFAVWAGGGLGLNNLPYERSFSGLATCLAAGLPFLKMSFYSTFFFGAMLFGGYHLFNRSTSPQQSIA